MELVRLVKGENVTLVWLFYLHCPVADQIKPSMLDELYLFVDCSAKPEQ